MASTVSRGRKIPIRVVVWIAGAATLAGLLIAVLQGYPWLSVEGASFGNPNDPFSELFYVKNDGYVSAVDLSADCSLTGSAQGVHFDRGTVVTSVFARSLVHSSRAMLPCNKVVPISHLPLAQMDYTVTVHYSVWPLTFQFLRRHQSFHFSGVNNENGQTLWTFVR
jgi:hypothetical protein